MYVKPFGVAAVVGFVLTVGLPAFGVLERVGVAGSQGLVSNAGPSVPVVVEGFEEVVSSSVFPNSSVGANFATSELVGGSSVLAAARLQLGWAQDCTALVENALRAVGYRVGDLAPWGFVSLGRVVPHGEALPGDLLVRGGHVAVYAGGGVAVHGGFNGSTVESSVDGDPWGYAVVVRLS